MAKKQQRKTAEFRAKAVRLVEESPESLAQVARDLEVKYQTLHGWVQKAKAVKARPPGGEPDMTAEAEVRALRRQLEEVTQERDFLKNVRAWATSCSPEAPASSVGFLRGAAVSLLVLSSPLKNMVQGWLRT